MSETAFGIFLFIAGFWFRGQFVGLKWKHTKEKPKPEDAGKSFKESRIKCLNPTWTTRPEDKTNG